MGTPAKLQMGDFRPTLRQSRGPAHPYGELVWWWWGGTATHPLSASAKHTHVCLAVIVRTSIDKINNQKAKLSILTQTVKLNLELMQRKQKFLHKKV